MNFDLESAKKCRVITDRSEKKYFYGATVNKDEWANCTELKFTPSDLSFRGLSKVKTGLVVAFDSGSMTVDLDYPKAFRLIDQRESQDNTIIEEFLVQPPGQKDSIVLTRSSSDHLIPRLIQDHIITSKFGRPEALLPILI